MSQCVVPSSEVLELTEELQNLGGGDVAIGRAWAGAVVGSRLAAAAGGTTLDAPLDAACSGSAELLDALLQELWPWLQQGFSATSLLLLSSAAEGAGKPLTAANIASRVGAAALASGCQLGLSWQLVSDDGTADHFGTQQQVAGVPGKRQAADSAPSGLRPGSGAAACRSVTAGGSGQPACVVHAGSPADLQQLLAAAQRQVDEGTAATQDQQGAQLPSLILRLTLQPPDSQPAARLHIVQLESSSGVSQLSSQLRRTGRAEQRQVQHMRLQPSAQQVLPLLQEVADLHQRRREGPHVLAASKLSPLAHLVAPLVASSARLFVAADPSSSSSGGNVSGREGQQQLLTLLASLRHVQAVCPRGAPAGANTAGATAAGGETAACWMPCQEFLQRNEQRQAAERRRTGQVATVAAAEEQKRLHQAALQDCQQQQPAAGGKVASAAVPARKQQQQQQQQQQQEASKQSRPQQQAVHAYRPATYGSPTKAGQAAPAAAVPAAAVAAAGAATPPAAGAAAAAAMAATAGAVALVPGQGQGQAGEEQESERQEATAGPHGQEDGLASDQTGSGLPGADWALPRQSASLQELRQQFQSLYRETVFGAAVSSLPQPAGLETAAAAAASLPLPLSPSQPQKQRRQQQSSIAAGVAAADDISLHVAALRMRAVAEAQRAQQAQQGLFLEAGHNSGPASASATCRSPACRASGSCSSTGSPSCGGSTHSSCSRPASGASLGRQLERELLLLQQQTASKAAGSAQAFPATAPCGGGRRELSEQAEHGGAELEAAELEAAELEAAELEAAELEAAELASLGDLDPAASFSAFSRSALPARLPTGFASIRRGWASATVACAEEQQQAQQQWRQQEHWQHSMQQTAADGMAAPAHAAAATPVGQPAPLLPPDAPPGRSFAWLPSPPAASHTLAGRALPAVAESDAFDSVNLQRWLSPQRRAAVASVLGADDAADSPATQAGLPQPAATSYSSRHAHSNGRGDGGEDGRSGSRGGLWLQRGGRFPDCRGGQVHGMERQQAADGSYTVAWQRHGHAACRTAAAANDSSSSPASSRQQGLLHPSALAPSAGGGRQTPAAAPAAAPEAAVECSLAATRADAGGEAALFQELLCDAAGEAAVLQELQCERRLNTTLLHQLHQMQQELQEVAAAAAAASAPPPDQGVEDPEDFNALLAALQLERRQHGALRQQMLIQQQQAEEQVLLLETQLLSQHRQLLVATARCHAWEQQSPLAPLFSRYEADLQRVEARCEQLQEESAQLAAMLAEADLQRLTGSAERLPEAAAAVCREHQRKLQLAQAQNRKLLEERAALQKQLQGAQRRDRLAVLCRRQAESCAKTSAELRQQLAARERQLEAQALAAAEAAADVARLQGRLQSSERELGQALADRADLQDIVDSLRKQVGVLRGQLSKDRILKSMQFPAP